MNRFYLKELRISGGNHEDSIISFQKGLNLILGPSNTGKSLMVDCIDYTFGFTSKSKKISRIEHNRNGYDTLMLSIITNEDYQVSFTRKIHTSKIIVAGNHPKIENGSYSVYKNAKKNINKVFLSLIGIDEIPKILQNENGAIQDLTFRSILHLFLLKQDDIDREISALLYPNIYTDTPSLAALLYLINQQDANDIEKSNDSKISSAKTEAVSLFIRTQIDRYSKQKLLLENQLDNDEFQDIESTKDFLYKQINQLQNQLTSEMEIVKDIDTSKQETINSLNEQISIHFGFAQLQEQYESDRDRISFLLEGNTHFKFHNKIKCPICNSEIDEPLEEIDLDSSKAELTKINYHLGELSKADKTLSTRIKSLQEKINEFEEERQSHIQHINQSIKPNLKQMEDKLDKIIKKATLQKQIADTGKYIANLNEELTKQEQEVSEEKKVYKIKNDYENKVFQQFEKLLFEAIRESRFDNVDNLRFNTTQFDLELNGKPKSAFAGGGYTSVLNTLMAFSVLRFLIENNGIAPGFLIIDSALSQLSESTSKKEKNTIKRNFVQYLAKHASEVQLILIEHEEDIAHDIPELKDANIVRFTKDATSGRYGFLNDVQDF